MTPRLNGWNVRSGPNRKEARARGCARHTAPFSERGSSSPFKESAQAVFLPMRVVVTGLAVLVVLVALAVTVLGSVGQGLQP